MFSGSAVKMNRWPPILNSTVLDPLSGGEHCAYRCSQNSRSLHAFVARMLRSTRSIPFYINNINGHQKVFYFLFWFFQQGISTPSPLPFSFFRGRRLINTRKKGKETYQTATATTLWAHGPLGGGSRDGRGSANRQREAQARGRRGPRQAGAQK